MPKGKPMTKSQITAHLAEKLELPKKTAGAFLEEFAELAAKETKNAGVFTLPGIGKLRKANRKARKGRNPATGEEIQIPAKTVVKARLSKVFKDAVVPPKKR